MDRGITLELERLSDRDPEVNLRQVVDREVHLHARDVLDGASVNLDLSMVACLYDLDVTHCSTCSFLGASRGLPRSSQ